MACILQESFKSYIVTQEISAYVDLKISQDRVGGSF
jgi:hypothetical protein